MAPYNELCAQMEQTVGPCSWKGKTLKNVMNGTQLQKYIWSSHQDIEVYTALLSTTTRGMDNRIQLWWKIKHGITTIICDTNEQPLQKFARQFAV